MIVCGALATPGCWLVKVRLEGFTLNAGGAMPVPLSETVWVLSESVMVSVPEIAPACVGANCTLIVPMEWAAICVVNWGVETNCGLAATVMDVSGRSPVLVMVTGCAAESWPSGVAEKVSEVGFRMSVGGGFAGAAQLDRLRSIGIGEGEQAVGWAGSSGRELHLNLAVRRWRRRPSRRHCSKPEKARWQRRWRWEARLRRC